MVSSCPKRRSSSFLGSFYECGWSEAWDWQVDRCSNVNVVLDHCGEKGARFGWQNSQFIVYRYSQCSFQHSPQALCSDQTNEITTTCRVSIIRLLGSILVMEYRVWITGGITNPVEVVWASYQDASWVPSIGGFPGRSNWKKRLCILTGLGMLWDSGKHAGEREVWTSALNPLHLRVAKNA